MKRKKKKIEVETVKQSGLIRLIDYLESKPAIPIAIVFAVVFFAFVLKVDMSLLFKDTLLTGGDSASWYQPLQHLKEVLIPNGRLFGWTQANFFGYNEFQFYFIVPFLIAVFFSLFMPLTIALKITTVLGLLSLPVVSFITGKKLTKNLWAALSAALLSLIFIFNQSYTMFGANFLSTMAGEFCFSIAFSLFILFIGVTYEAYEKDKNPLFSGILLGLIGLSHLFVFMPAVFVPFYFLIYDKIKRRKFEKLAKTEIGLAFSPIEKTVSDFSGKRPFEKTGLIYGVGILLMAFWLIPMLMTRQFSQPIAMSWIFQDFMSFVNYTFFGLIVAGFLISIILFLFSPRHRASGGMYLFLILGCAFFFLISPFLEIADIRFVPPALMLSIFPIAACVEYMPRLFKKKHEKAARLGLFSAALVGTIAFLIFYPSAAGAWFEWNNSGYEAKQEYGNLLKIQESYSGDIDSGRILWEKQNQNDNADFGSERGFENLYLFTGRPSMEGIHYGSSYMARPVTYLQSEYSQNPVDPEMSRIYSTVNSNVMALRFYQANAKDIILYSDTIKSMFTGLPDFNLTGEFGKFQIYSYTNYPGSYVQVTDSENLNILNDSAGMKMLFYRYFRDYELYNHPFIPSGYLDEEDTEIFSEIPEYSDYDSYKNEYYDPNFNFDDWLSNYAYGEAISDETVEHFDIRFTTAQPGKPHIIKIAYSPNFKSENGEKIYPVSPGFMMIIPSSSEVRIHYGWNIYEIIGLILTLLLIPIFIFWKRIRELAVPFADILSTAAIVLFCGLVVLFLSLSVFGPKVLSHQYAKAVELYSAGEYAQSLEILDKYATIGNLDKYDNVVIYSYWSLKAQAQEGVGDYTGAAETMEYLMARYSHSRLNVLYETYLTGLQMKAATQNSLIQ